MNNIIKISVPEIQEKQAQDHEQLISSFASNAQSSDYNMSAIENELELIMLSFMVKDINAIKFCLANGVNNSWFFNDDVRAFFQRVISFYQDHRSILTKKYYLQRIEAYFKIKNISNPVMAPYEQFYDTLLAYDYDEEDLNIKFTEWREYVVSQKILSTFKDYYDYKKFGNDIKISHDKLIKDLTKYKAFFDSEKSYRRASLAKDAKMVLDDFINRKENPEAYCGYTLGFDAVDERFSGIEKGKMVVIMGPSSHGKTCLARNITRHIQKKYSARICVISCEESRLDYMKKLVCAELDLTLRSGNRGLLGNAQLTSVSDKIEELSNESETGSCYEIIEVDARKFTIEELEVIIEDEFGADYFDVVMLDHLSLVKAAQKAGEHEHIELGDISKFFRDMARRHNFAGILIAQANRSSYKLVRQKRELDMFLENIEGSNKPGQDTDKAIAIRIRSDDPSIGILKVVKDREGERDYEIEVAAQLDKCKFVNMSVNNDQFKGDITSQAFDYKVSPEGEITDYISGKQLKIPLSNKKPNGKEEEISPILGMLTNEFTFN